MMNDWQIYVMLDKGTGKLLIEAVAGTDVDAFADLVEHVGTALCENTDTRLGAVGRKILDSLESQE